MHERQGEPRESIGGQSRPGRFEQHERVDQRQQGERRPAPVAEVEQIQRAQPRDRQREQSEHSIRVQAQAQRQHDVQEAAGRARDSECEIGGDSPAVQVEEYVGGDEDQWCEQREDRDVGLAHEAEAFGAQTGHSRDREDRVQARHACEPQLSAELDRVELEQQCGDEEQEGAGVGNDQDAVLAEELLERRAGRGGGPRALGRRRGGG